MYSYFKSTKKFGGVDVDMDTVYWNDVRDSILKCSSLDARGFTKEVHLDWRRFFENRPREPKDVVVDDEELKIKDLVVPIRATPTHPHDPADSVRPLSEMTAYHPLVAPLTHVNNTAAQQAREIRTAERRITAKEHLAAITRYQPQAFVLVRIGDMDAETAYACVTEHPLPLDIVLVDEVVNCESRRAAKCNQPEPTVSKYVISGSYVKMHSYDTAMTLWFEPHADGMRRYKAEVLMSQVVMVFGGDDLAFTSGLEPDGKLGDTMSATFKPSILETIEALDEAEWEKWGTAASASTAKRDKLATLTMPPAVVGRARPTGERSPSKVPPAKRVARDGGAGGATDTRVAEEIPGDDLGVSRSGRHRRGPNILTG